MSSTKMLYLLGKQRYHNKYLLSYNDSMENINTQMHFLVVLPDVPEGQFRQVRQLLHLDDGVVERRLQALGHHVCEDDGHHHGQDVRDLTGQLEADYCSGNRVCDGSRHGCRTWKRAADRAIPLSSLWPRIDLEYGKIRINT